jgi:rfaE bifunctional protein kinase chain/domain
MKKIFELEELSRIIQNKKKQGKRIVLCHGVFDVLHLGHLEHFKKSKSNGDILVVTTTADKFINKGLGRPYFSSKIRTNLLSGLSAIDYISEVPSETAIPAIKLLKPNFYCKGVDYKKLSSDITKNIKLELKELKKVKGKILFTNEVTFSSSQILNNQNITLNNFQLKEVKQIKKNYNFSDIEGFVNKASKLKVLIIGEVIIDQYFFCDPLGKSGKDPIMMFNNIKNSKYLGGSGAIANHLSEFCKKIKLISVLGQKKEHLNFIKNTLKKNITLDYVKKENSPTILKQKYIDNVSSKKIIGFYNFNDSALNKNSEATLRKKIQKNIKKYDLVIVSYYGHGMISNLIAKFICKSSKFLIMNSQYNAANIGHHTLKKYLNTHCTVINESELRHELRDRSLSVETLIKKFSKISKQNYLVVTRGSDGSTAYDKKNNKFYYSQAYARKITDKIGSGDVLMGVLATILSVKKDPHLAMFIASIAAGQSVEKFANSESIQKKTLLKAIKHMLL